MLPVNKPYLPEIEKYKSYIDRIFKSNHLTNSGPLVQELESKLSDRFGVKHAICVANGSLALQILYKAMNLEGDVITTPFSFAATTSTMTWEGLKPVFCDIDSESLNINADKIEELITERTSAIVPVHVFGNPCDVEKIAQLSAKHNIKVIYDAAHAFDIEYDGKSILNYGDASTISFHATKIFHTIEGGAVFTNCDRLAKDVRNLINFGIVEGGELLGVGTNAKMNEFEAAMGLCILDDIGEIIEKRKELVTFYHSKLEGLSNISLQKSSQSLFSYMPVILDSEEVLLRTMSLLKENDIFARRYFYPSLNQALFGMSKDKVPNAESISCRIMCLPLFFSLNKNEITMVTNIIEEALK
ncbi:DegT/DnrJ/EryC1/StrS family aminotransferase [Vibrio sp. Vb2131]|uniref:DegT/DnrJ/EryC1/StrS family aminotransferase n=1 Tax=Vibrio sp. Vb2131 TaxID=3074649 RepID=UPI0029647ABD|nr:DegT/DnrJ/EryC1/StrS family aminotransferase [Vibrio sp. Vb2131]MDW1886845.1 DegT/DnrJ/EryC1/StrS family aminotransferase [Vibrio sp. Vb2131]